MIQLGPLVRSVLRDFRDARRGLLRSPAVTAMAVATFALGIGANVAIFTVVRGVLLRPLPYAAADRLVVVWEDLLREGNHRFSVAWPNFVDLGARARGSADLAAQLGKGVQLTGAEGPEAALGAQVTGNFFNVLGARAAIGRTIGPEDGLLGPTPVAVIQDSLWKRRYAGDPGILGRRILLDGKPFVVIGIMPPGFEFPAQLKAPHMMAQVWTPLDLPAGWETRGVATLQVVGRLADGISLEAADARIRAVATGLAAEYPETNGNVGMHAVSLVQQMFGNVRPGLAVLTAAALLLLIAACASIAHVLLGRALARQREVALRVALGARRAHIVRWLVAEGILLAAAGGAIGFGLAVAGTRALLARTPRQIPWLDQVRPDAAVFFFALGMTLLAGLAASLVPAWFVASRGLQNGLRRGGWAFSPGTTRLASVIVVSQVAIALFLFAGAALLVKTFESLRRFDTGFSSEGVMTARLFLPRTGYATAASRLEFFERTFDRLKAIPGVEAVGGTSRFPLDPAYGVGSIRFEGRDPGAANRPVVGVRLIAGDYFRALRIPVLHGRAFDSSDRGGAASALVNRTMASRHWPGESPLGKRISIGEPEAWLTVVGVVGDVSHDGIDAAALPEVYLPFSQSPDSGLNLVVRAAAGVSALPEQIRRAVKVEDPDLPLVELRPMTERVEEALAEPRFLAETLGFFGSTSLLLAALAVFGLVANDTARRRKEIGIRLALGAPTSRVAGLFLWRAMRLTAFGVAIGLGGVALAAPRLGRTLHGTSPADADTLAAATAVLIASVFIAVLLPVLRSLRSDPLESLRSE